MSRLDRTVDLAGTRQLDCLSAMYTCSWTKPWAIGKHGERQEARDARKKRVIME